MRAREPSTPPANLTALETPLNRSLRLTSRAPVRIASVAPVALLLALGATSALAGTTGTESWGMVWGTVAAKSPHISTV